MSALEQPGAPGETGDVEESGDGTFVGQIVGKLALIALVTDESRLIAYVCDGVETGKTISQWYEGDIGEDGYFWLEPAGAAEGTAQAYSSGVLWGTFKDGFATGEMAVANGENLRWFAMPVGPDSPGGLYVDDDGESVTSVVVLNEHWGQGLSRSRLTGRRVRVAPPRRMRRAREITVRTRRRTIPVRRVRTPIRLVDRGLVNRFKRPPPPRVPDPGVVIPAPTNTIQIKFREGLRIRLVGGTPRDSNLRALRSRTALDLLDSVAGGTWSRSHTVSPGRLDDLRRTGEKRTGKKLPDLNLYYTLRLPPGRNARVLVNLFKRLPEVEEAWIVPSYVLTAPGFQDSNDVLLGAAYQQYLDPAPNGVDAHYAWGFDGGNGAGVNVIDIEKAFNPDHVDLPDVQIGIPWAVGAPAGGDIAHGTATLGVIAGLPGESGITGIAHGSSMYFASILAEGAFAGSTGALEAVTGLDSGITSVVLGQNAQPGDVIVLELQARGPEPFPNVPGPLLPVEWYGPVYDAIRLATANGFVVVEAAGNGNTDLDAAFLLNDPDAPHQPFRMDGNTRVNDSGAIIVGAGTSGAAWSNTQQPQAHLRSGSSNYGGRVDLHAWGDAIVTLGDGGPQFTIYDGGPNDMYRSSYAATSGATAIVGGTVAAFQGFFKEFYGDPLTSAGMRTLLVGTGTPQFDESDGHIGPMPDLRAAIDERLAAPPPEPGLGLGGFGCDLPPLIATFDCQGETPLPEPSFSVRSGVISAQDFSSVRPIFPDPVPAGSVIEFTLDGLPQTVAQAQAELSARARLILVQSQAQGQGGAAGGLQAQVELAAAQDALDRLLAGKHEWTVSDTVLCNSLASPDAKFEGVTENFTEPLIFSAWLFNDVLCGQSGAVSRTVKAAYVPPGFINPPVFDTVPYGDDLKIHMSTGYPHIEGVENAPESYPDGYAFVAYTLDGGTPVAADDAINGANSPVWNDLPPGYDDGIRIFAGGQNSVTLKARVYLRVDDDIFVGGEVVQQTYFLNP